MFDIGSFFSSTEVQQMFKKIFDRVVVDHDVLWSQNIDQLSLTILSQQKTSPQAVLYHALHKKENILLILTQDCVGEYLWALKEYEHVTIINISTGIWSLSGGKSCYENNDVALALQYGYHVYDPRDDQDLLGLCTQSHRSYIKVSPQLVLSSEVQSLGKLSTPLHQFQFGIDGSSFTLLVFGPHFVEGIQTINLLHAKNINGDLFVSTSYNFNLDASLISSLHATEKLIVVIDQQQQTLFSQFLKAKLFDAGLFKVYLTFITPAYDTLTTLLPEYIIEQAQLDAPHMVHTIEKILQ